MSVTADGLSMTWGVARTAGGLEVTYTVKNERPGPIWLLDQVLVYPPGTGVAFGPDHIVVREPPGEGLPITLARGYVPPNGFPQFELPPGGREVAAGATVSGAATVALPLETWHPNEQARRPIAGVTTAVLRLGWLNDPPTEVRKTVDGAVVKVPSTAQSRSDQLWIEGPAISF